MERFRKAVEPVNAGDIETALDAMHPDVEWRTLDTFPDAGTYHGPEAVQAFFQTWLDTFKGFQLHLENRTAVEVNSPPFFQVVEFRDGLMLRARMFEAESEALEAAGLRE